MRVAIVVIGAVAAVVSAALEWSVFHWGPVLSVGATTISTDAFAAVLSFRALIAFAIALAVAEVNAIVVALAVAGKPAKILAACVAAMLVWVIGICAAVLSTVMFLVPLVLFVWLFVYALPAIVAGDKAPLEGLFTSFRTAMAHPLPTLRIAGWVIVVSVIGAWIGAYAGRASDVAGWLLAGVAQQGIVAYASLLAVRQLASTGAEAGL